MIPARAGVFSQYFVLELRERDLTCCQEVISSLTRMHFSRMRTTRFNGHLYKGEYLSQGGVCPGSYVQRICPEGCVQELPSKSNIFTARASNCAEAFQVWPGLRPRQTVNIPSWVTRHEKRPYYVISNHTKGLRITSKQTLFGQH